jgi:DNA-binding response OmpR family regulator
VRIALVSQAQPAEALEILRDLGCRLVEHAPTDDPVEIAHGGDAVLVECGADVDPMRALLFRLRRAGAASVLLAVRSEQVLRVDPGWPFDDLTLQPYVAPELYLRLKVLEWRRRDAPNDLRIEVGAMRVDLGARAVDLAGDRVPLSPQEFALLAYLTRFRGRAVSREVLLRDVWGLRSVETRTVDVHIRKLRQKLGEAVIIDTVRGVGYRLDAMTKDSAR